MSWTRRSPVLAFVVGLGCQNNTITLDFERGPDPSTGVDSDDSNGTTDDGTEPVTTTGEPGGPQTLLLALDTPLASGLPFQAIVSTTPGTSTVDLTLQFLSLAVGSTTSPRQPVGDVYAYTGLPTDASGVFYWDTGIILIPGAANPISGSDAVVSIQANVVPAGSPAYCGVAGGVVLSPIEASLDGSTHAMTAVPDAGNLPFDFPVRCP